MVNPFRKLACSWNDPELWRRERWWVVLWITWGTLCSVAIGLGDQSLTAGTLLVRGKRSIAAFGQPVWAIFSLSIFSVYFDPFWNRLPTRTCRTRTQCRPVLSTGWRTKTSNFLTRIGNRGNSCL